MATLILIIALDKFENFSTLTLIKFEYDFIENNMMCVDFKC